MSPEMAEIAAVATARWKAEMAAEVEEPTKNDPMPTDPAPHLRIVA